MDEEPSALGGNQDKKQSYCGQGRPSSVEGYFKAAAALLSFNPSTGLMKMQR
jgi:hypothetical protein